MTTTTHARGGCGPIKAASGIRYRGYIISISMSAEPPEILVYHETTGEGIEQLPATADGITQATQAIDDRITQAYNDLKGTPHVIHENNRRRAARSAQSQAAHRHRQLLLLLRWG